MKPEPANPSRKAPARGASVAKTRLADRGQAWWQHHRSSAAASLGKLLRAPAHTLMTALAVAIALALPATLFALLENVYRLSDQWDSNPKLTVYLQHQLPPTQVQSVVDAIETLPGVADLEHVSAAQALELFQNQSGFAGALDVLDENPLPDTLILTPAATHSDVAALQILSEQLAQRPGVDSVELDLQWVKKLKAMMALGEKLVMGLSGLLSVGVLLVIGNTIRLEIENRREEIVVVKLVGGTNGFVRRPLLYTGAWYGALGALLACCLTSAAIALLAGSVSRLASSYHSSFALRGIGLEGSAALLALGAVLGLLGAWVAVARHLYAIEPR